MNKKGVSIMVGYVLLVSIAIVMSIVVYQWIKTYVPKDALECPDGVSIFLKEYSYDCDTNRLSITLRNNGRFNIAGYYIHGTETEEQELAINDLSEYGGGTSGTIYFGTGSSNSFAPDDLETDIFDLSDSGIERVYSIEIIPVKYEEFEGKTEFVICSKKEIKQNLKCEAEIETSCDGIWNSIDEDSGVECDGTDSNCVECICQFSYEPDEEGGCVLGCLSGQEIGDINGDDEINSIDINLASDIDVELITGPENICCGDVNQDEEIDIVDSVLIQQYVEGNNPPAYIHGTC